MALIIPLKPRSKAQFMSRGVGEMAAWRAEQREADEKPTHRRCWRCNGCVTTFFISIAFWKAVTVKMVFDGVWFALRVDLLWAGGSKASRNFGCIPDLTFFLPVNIHVFPCLFAISMFGCFFNAMFVRFASWSYADCRCISALAALKAAEESRPKVGDDTSYLGFFASIDLFYAKHGNIKIIVANGRWQNTTLTCLQYLGPRCKWW